jgi:hypothetical protein
MPQKSKKYNVKKATEVIVPKEAKTIGLEIILKSEMIAKNISPITKKAACSLLDLPFSVKKKHSGSKPNRKPTGIYLSRNPLL